MRLGESLAALRERQFRLLYAGQTFSNLGSALVPIALAFAVLDLTGSATDLGLVLLASRLPQVLLVLAGGVVGDRLPRRRVMLASDLARCVVQATTAVLLATGTAQLWQLLVLQAAHGAAAAFFDPAATGLVPQTVSPGRLQQANALMGLSRSTTGILGQVGAGVLVATVGPALALAVDAASFAASAWSLALLAPPGTVRIGQETGFFAQLAAGWAEFRSRSWLWASVLHVSLLNLVVLAPFFVLGPLVALRSLGGAAGWATIATAYATGAVAGGVVGLRWRPRRPLLAAVLAVFALAPLIAGLAIAAPLPVLAVAGLFGGLQASLHEVLWNTSLQQHLPAEALSRVSAYGWLGALLFAPLGYALAGPVADWLGVATTLWVGAAWVLVSTSLVLAVPSIRSLQRTDLFSGQIGLSGK
jgi:MFS family permease